MIHTQVRTELLNRKIQCECHKTHFVSIERVRIGQDIAHDIIDFLSMKNFRSVFIVSDINTHRVFGATLSRDLLGAGFSVATHVFRQEHDLLPDETAVSAVSQALRNGVFHQSPEEAMSSLTASLDDEGSRSRSQVDVVLAVGSGVITDVVRYVTFMNKLPFISVATAPSMDGYASGMAAMQFNGIKVTFSAQPPIAIFAELSVLTTAPFALIRSGFGDMVGKVTSLTDWMLSTALYGEDFCEQAYNMVYEPLSYAVNHAENLQLRDSRAVQNLFVGLVNAGIAMAMVGSSRPCSGSEHHCSHYWDLLAFKGFRSHTPHGLQVGYATHFVSFLYQFLLQRLSSLKYISVKPVDNVNEDFVSYATRFYGQGAKEVIDSQREKLKWLSERSHQYQGLEDSGVSVRRALERMKPLLDQSSGALMSMRIPRTIGFIGVDEVRLRETLCHAKELRSRFTVLDLLSQQDCLQMAIDELIDSLKVS